MLGAAVAFAVCGAGAPAAPAALGPYFGLKENWLATEHGSAMVPMFRGLTVAADGSVYALGADEVERYTPDGQLQATWSTGTSSPPDSGGLGGAYAIAADPQGALYVTDDQHNSVDVFSDSGMLLAIWGSSAAAHGGAPVRPAQFDQPGWVTVAPSGDVYVIDRSSIQQFGRDGTLRNRVSWPYPGGWLSVDDRGDLYLSGYPNSYIEKLSPSGRLLAKWGDFKGSLDPRYGPYVAYGTAFDQAGHLWVADFDNGRFDEFGHDGTLTTYCRPTGPSSQTIPRSLAFSPSGDLYTVNQYWIARYGQVSPPTRPCDALAPRLSRIAARRHSGRPTTLSLVSSKPARLRVVVARRQARRWVVAATLSREIAEGHNTIELANHALPAGARHDRTRVQLTATDAAGNRSATYIRTARS